MPARPDARRRFSHQLVRDGRQRFPPRWPLTERDVRRRAGPLGRCWSRPARYRRPFLVARSRALSLAPGLRRPPFRRGHRRCALDHGDQLFGDRGECLAPCWSVSNTDFRRGRFDLARRSPAGRRRGRLAAGFAGVLLGATGLRLAGAGRQKASGGTLLSSIARIDEDRRNARSAGLGPGPQAAGIEKESPGEATAARSRPSDSGRSPGPPCARRRSPRRPATDRAGSLRPRTRRAPSS